MPKRELQFADGKSNKFWAITLKGKSHTVIYGRIDTAGQTLTKTFDSPAEAKASYTRLIESKLKKGYQDVSSTSTSTKNRTASKKKAATVKKRVAKKATIKHMAKKVVKKKVAKKATKKTAAKKKVAKKTAAAPKASKKTVKTSSASHGEPMSLIQTSRWMNPPHADFDNKKRTDSVVQSAWKSLLEHQPQVIPPIDVAVWEIGPRVNLRPACSQLDESHRDFVRPRSLFLDVKGYKQAQSKIQKQRGVDKQTIKAQLQELEQTLIERMTRSIVKGFKNKTIQKRLAEYNPENRPFTALITTEDKGLHASDFTVVVKNDRGPSVAQIKKKAASVKGKRPVVELVTDSVYRQRLNKLAKKREQEQKEYKAYWAAEREKADARKPGIEGKLAASIEQAEADLAAASKTAAKRKAAAKDRFLLSLDDGNQHERLLAPTVKLEQIAHIVATYPWANFDSRDNRFYEYATLFLNPLHKQLYKKRRPTWEKLNRQQKAFDTLNVFIGEIENGGVWQFLFNYPDLAIAALEALNEVGEKKLAKDYFGVLEEYFGKASTFEGLYKRAADKNFGSEKQWRAFAEGYQELKSAEKIQGYIYTAKFEKAFFKRISDYVEASYVLFAKIKT